MYQCKVTGNALVSFKRLPSKMFLFQKTKEEAKAIAGGWTITGVE